MSLKHLLSPLGILLFFVSPSERASSVFSAPTRDATTDTITLIVLGTVQDAGSPHIACTKKCCSALFKNPPSDRKVVSLGLIDSKNQQNFLFEATPDLTRQLKMLKKASPWEAPEIPQGIFLTHAHIGHYTGLMYLGKEASNTKNVPVYTLPKMQSFLESNGPWSQLVNTENIQLKPLKDQKKLALSSHIQVIPFTVPHRDEYSETVGYQIVGPQKKVLFIPDIDKWEKWNTSIVELISKVDYAFIDATFYDAQEINNRDISEIPHPFVVESMTLFKNLPKSEKAKIHLIHFNHTNPLLYPQSQQTQKVLEEGFNIARMGQVFEL